MSVISVPVTTPRLTRTMTVALLLLGAAVATVPFWLTDIDRSVSAFFHDAGSPRSAWPGAEIPPWVTLHRMTPWLAAGLGAVGLLMAVTGRLMVRRGREREPERGWALCERGLLLLLVLALGSGLVVNALVKDHWHRPRPRQTEGLGGDHRYVPPLAVGPYGKSFPCGDASVGFAIAALACAVRGRRPRFAAAWVATSVVAGLALGTARVAAGSHFLSDVLWSGVLVGGTLLALRPVVARIALAGSPGVPWSRPRRAAAAGAGAVLTAGILVMAVPFRQSIERAWAPDPANAEAATAGTAAGPGWAVALDMEAGSVRIVLEPGVRLAAAPPAAVVALAGEFDGFGFPGARVAPGLEVDPAARRVRLRVSPRGLFADLEGRVTVRVATAAVSAIDVEVADGILTLESTGAETLPALRCRTRPDALRLRGVRRDQVQAGER